MIIEGFPERGCNLIINNKQTIPFSQETLQLLYNFFSQKGGVGGYSGFNTSQR